MRAEDLKHVADVVAEVAFKALQLVREFNSLPPCDEGFLDDAIELLRNALHAPKYALSEEDIEAMTHQRSQFFGAQDEH
jgi:hypothetical protein